MSDLEMQPDAEAPEEPSAAPRPADPPVVSMDDWLGSARNDAPPAGEDAQLKAVLEAIIYVAEDPVTAAQAAAALNQPPQRIQSLLNELAAEFDKPEHGLAVKEVAGGYKMATKAEHHDSVRAFVKSLKAPLKLSLPALETLAVVAYKQPVTSPEIMEIRGVQGAGVLKTLLDRKLIAAAGRKNVIGKPILYRTTKEFLVQFGLKDLSELPTLKEFEELRQLAFADDEPPAPEAPSVEASAEQAAAPSEAAPASGSEAVPGEAAAPAEHAPAADAAAESPAPESAGEPPESSPESELPAGEPEAES
ncbi:MAG TPA: SMC-Scp complex subunit ScpB [Bryobacteraceae bacterium]|nr:SMC-Scp complex subunit ScpB [Bryobacteraceae bacterium]